MASGNSRKLRSSTQVLLGVLSARKDNITWASDAVKLYHKVQSLYGTISINDDTPNQVKEFWTKICELELYTTIDLECHIGVKNGGVPLYLPSLLQLLQQGEGLLSDCNANGTYNCTVKQARQIDHLSAQLQTSFTEYGFCQVYDAIYDVDEASQKLDTLLPKLSDIETKLTSQNTDIGLVLIQLHDVIATQYGTQQAMTESNIDRMKKKFDQIDERILKIENQISSLCMKEDSEFVLHYLACQHLLNQPFVKSITGYDTADVINSHMIHPGTRSWVLERFNRWFTRTDKRLYVIGGREGTGKTALSSAICKLYSHSTAATHFCDAAQKGSHINTLNGLLQSLAFDLCNTVPEYLNWMDDKYSNNDLRGQLSESWQTTYNLLFKQPFQDLYGVGSKSASNLRRKLIVIDGADQLSPAEWKDFHKFLSLVMKDLSSSLCLLVTVKTDEISKLIPVDDTGELVDGLKFEDRAWINRHIKDIEIYLSGSLGAILSGEDEVDAPFRAKADESTLQKTVDELLKSSGGRFDYAIELMESFAAEMIKSSGQFLSSLKKGLAPVQDKYKDEMEEQQREFASPYRAYRDNEGRSVRVRVMRQNHYLMDKTRVALIRGRHNVLH